MKIDIFKFPWFVLSIYPERLKLLNTLFNNYNLNIPRCFEGFKFENLTGFENNMLGHVALIKWAKLQNLPGMVIFEDDVYPCYDIKEKLQNITEVPDDLEILDLGWIQNNNQIVSRFNHISNNPLYGTHSYLILKNGYDTFLNYFSTTKRNADWIFCSGLEHIYFLNECLFIQYNNGKSVGNHQKYRYNDGLGHNDPPIGFDKIEIILNKNMKTAVFTIAKDEDNYIDEFLDYYIKLGFDDIWIYQNNWRANLKSDYNGRVHLVEFDGEAPQRPALNDFCQKHWNEYDWVAFFDVDEFLLLKNHTNIKDFLEDYKKFPAIGLNMRLFGDSGLKNVENENYSVINRFTHSNDKLNSLIKLIINFDACKDRVRFFNPHIFNGQAVDPNKTKLTTNGNFPNNTLDEVAELAHFRNKTYEECYKRKFKNTDVMYGYLDKVNDPNSGRLNLDVFNKEFAEHNHNEILNTSILDFYKKIS